MKTLVIGASENPERYSNKAIKMLELHNHEIVAIGNKVGKVGNTKIITHWNNEDKIDTITLYIGAKHQNKYYDLVKDIMPRRIVFNPGTENEELENVAKELNIEVLHACTLVMLSTKQY